jgi:uncharacterized membrane protein YfcA
MGVGVVIGGQLAAATSKYVPDRLLMRLLCAGLFVVGIRMIAQIL